jgi:hypothetical protein
MRKAIYASAVIAGTCFAAALSAAVVGWIGVNVLGICDPKFGCTFGIQFSALVAGVFGLLGSLVFVCLSAAYTTFSHRSLPPRRALLLAILAGISVGAAYSAAALTSYA